MERKTHRTAEENKRLLLQAATRLFLQKGYSATTLREIAKEADVNIGSLMYICESKENILAELVGGVLDKQLRLTDQLLSDITEEPVLYWATERTLQIHVAESSEAMRELYLAAYSMPKPTDVIFQWMAEKLQFVFRNSFPRYEGKDFYELEIASGGIMRSFMSVPCDLYFDINRKVRRYLETSFRLYRLSEEKAQETFHFVSAIDFTDAADRLGEMLLNEMKN